MKCDNTNIARFEAGRVNGGGSSPFVLPEGTQANVVIGTFTRGEDVRVVISNARCDEPAVFSLKFSCGRTVRRVFTSIDAEENGRKGTLRAWHLEPGGSVILDLK